MEGTYKFRNGDEATVFISSSTLLSVCANVESGGEYANNFGVLVGTCRNEKSQNKSSYKVRTSDAQSIPLLTVEEHGSGKNFVRPQMTNFIKYMKFVESSSNRKMEINKFVGWYVVETEDDVGEYFVDVDKIDVCEFDKMVEKDRPSILLRLNLKDRGAHILKSLSVIEDGEIREVEFRVVRDNVILDDYSENIKFRITKEISNHTVDDQELPENEEVQKLTEFYSSEYDFLDNQLSVFRSDIKKIL